MKRVGFKKSSLFILEVLSTQLVLIIIITATLRLDQVQCSSYVDDYFLPSAKFALQKISQSLGAPANSASGIQEPTKNIEEQQQLNSNYTPTQATSLQQQESSNNSNPSPILPPQPPQSNNPTTISEPSKGEFVKLDIDDSPTILQNKTQSQIDPVETSTLIVLSSSEATDKLDPSLLVSSSSSSELPATDDPTTIESSEIKTEPASKIAEVVYDEPASTTTTTTTTTTTPTTPTPTTTTESDLPSVVIQTASDDLSTNKIDDSVRETELNAVAAVDASIGFGDPFAGINDSCYDEYGNARYCEPEFENIAYEKVLEVSSECGKPASRFCTAQLNERNDQVRNCHMCDAQHPKKRHPASFLTDLNQPGSPTCWVSGPISVSANFNDSSNSQIRGDNVTLTLNLGKSYEITYVSMQFCSLKPDSLAIYKSSDFGQSWQAYQFYSSQCQRLYQKPQLQAGKFSRPFEASCTNASFPSPSAISQQANSGRIAFVTHEPRGLNSLAATSANYQTLQENWITATNIKIVLDRHQASWIQSSLINHAHRSHSNNNEQQQLPSITRNNQHMNNSSAMYLDLQTIQEAAPSSLTNPSDTYNYAISDLTVGGRCKCNGHASRCFHSPEGRLQCDCWHNTAGLECERCASLHHDRPWAKATQQDANPCQPCNCNGHSRKCKFDPELYQLSGKRSGGVCLKCQHNTDGRHCHYCKEGFTRDHSKLMSDKEACKPCDCHPLGSMGTACNQTTGQCPCKEGVTGIQCSRCAPGYQQSNSATEPCIKLPSENDINSAIAIGGLDQDQSQSSDENNNNNNHPNDNDSPQVSVITDEPELGKFSSGGGGGRVASSNEIYGDENKPELVGYTAPEQDLQNLDPYPSNNGFVSQISAPRRMRPVSYLSSQQPHQKRMKHPSPIRPKSSQRWRNSYSPAEEEDFGVEQDIPPLNERDNLYEDVISGGADQDGFGRENSRRLFIQPFNPYSQEGSRRARPLNRPLQPPTIDGDDSDQDPQSYPMEDFSNQIQTPRHASSSAQASLNRGRGRYRYPVEFQPDQSIAETRVSCGDCQSAIRKLSTRQFCRLDFAVKATVLQREVAEDWTKYDVEIKDIFKSPQTILAGSSTSSQHHHHISNRLARAFTVDNNNSLMASLQQIGNKTSSEIFSPSTNGLAASDQLQLQNPFKHIKIGSVLPIWTPTEDLTCKCPKLKHSSTYLIMGMLDPKENSPNTLQLDRHGVAIEWKSTLQGKLMSAQRRQARGKC